ncbi:MAG TPA: hypothetical protein VFE30_07725 [Anaeromyxobacteraceae bacterium]|jgi:hypothetical protein|nr:hypothetical protein [Anaeromyxobacteraceae bacterium]
MSSPAATRAQRLAEEIAARARRLAEDFRRADRYFKLRAGVIACWAVISIATIFGACPSAGPGNDLGADVALLKADPVPGEQAPGEGKIVGSAKIMVRNESDDIWTDVVLKLDGRWRYDQATMRPRDYLVLLVSQFRQGDDAPPSDYRPRVLEIRCGQGRHRFELR